jgi:hypothetical protein
LAVTQKKREKSRRRGIVADMNANRSARLAGTVALLGWVAGGLNPAFAQNPAPAAASTPTAIPLPPPVVQAAAPEPAWRRFAVPSALVASGLGLATGVVFFNVKESRTKDFNAHMNPVCSEARIDNGGPDCRALLDGIKSARTRQNIGFGAAGAFAVTALILKLTAPASTSADASHAAAPMRLACAPGLGLNASCALTF